jgi:hypothetical protein
LISHVAQGFHVVGVFHRPRRPARFILQRVDPLAPSSSTDWVALSEKSEPARRPFHHLHIMQRHADLVAIIWRS